MITVTICDPYKLWRTGIRQILSEHKEIKVFDDVRDSEELIPSIKRQQPDIIILEMDLPGRSGLDVMDQLQSMYPGIRFLILSRQPADPVALRMYKAGARGYLTKDSDPDELIKAIRLLAADKIYLSSSVSQMLYHKVTQANGNELHEKLSDREFEVMMLLGKGKRNAEIAKLLSLSVKTISTYRSRIFEKMNITSITELVQYLVKHKLMDPEITYK